MANISSSQYDYNLIKEGLNAANLRSKVISNNIANVNTAGYKAYDVTFEDNLKSSMDELDLKTTDSRHIQDGSSTNGTQIVQDNSGSMKEDGNNVDIDQQMGNLAANQLDYNALITQLNNRLSIRRFIINDGRG